jgi:hypothetical protein
MVGYRNLRLQPKTAFSRFPRAHRADSAGRSGSNLPFQKGRLASEVSDLNDKVTKQNIARANWGPAPARCRVLFSPS